MKKENDQKEEELFEKCYEFAGDLERQWGKFHENQRLEKDLDDLKTEKERFEDYIRN